MLALVYSSHGIAAIITAGIMGDDSADNGCVQRAYMLCHLCVRFMRHTDW